eukprot:22140-Rhodomonas_salina.2
MSPDRPCHNLDRFAQSRSLGWGAVHSLFFGPILENFNVLELSVSSCLETGQGWQQDLPNCEKVSAVRSTQSAVQYRAHSALFSTDKTGSNLN